MARIIEPVSISLHGGERAGLPDRARGAVEAREDAELDLGEAEAGGVVARGDALVAGERQLEPAAEAEAVDGSTPPGPAAARCGRDRR